MSAAIIIERAQKIGVRLALEAGQLTAEGPKDAVAEILPALRQHKPELLLALSTARPAEPDPAETSGRWLVIQAPQRLEKFFTPVIARAELQRRYPGAVLIPLPDTTAAVDLELSPRTPKET